MAKQDGEAPGVPRAIQSQGEDAARAYAVGEVAPRPLHPTVEMERVHIEDPRRVPPPRADARRGGGARNPDQRAPLADVGAPGVAMPEGLPVTKRQPIVIDSEILAEWHGDGGAPAESGAAGAGATGAGAGATAVGGATAGAGAGATSGAGATVVGGATAGADATAGTGATGKVPRLAEIAAARRAERRAGWQRAAWVVAMGVLLAIGTTVVRSGRGARDGAVEAARGAGDEVGSAAASVRRAEGTAAESAPAPVASGAPVISVASAASVVSGAAGANAAPGAAAASTLPAPRSRPAPAAMTAQQSRPGAPAAARGAPSAGGAAASARDAPSRPAGAATAQEGPGAPRPPSPYDTPNFD
ncbi:hypothetical protein [Sorangium sp. So ce1335]|uniref:hypothetical protein n=1 Tax=Sorangium sp. So ce1335 TaxID=3133335 RepID=UPI003F5DBCAF